MSLVFSDTSNKKGIIQKIERLIKLGDGAISGDTTLLKEFTSDINLALDAVFGIIFSVGGTWQFDDSNHTDYPIIKTDLVSGQRDYGFTVDENINLVLDIYRVLVKDSNGIYQELEPVDAQSSEDVAGFYDGQELTGTPTKYDKTANGIFLDKIPSYNSDDGLKIYINREASYFATSDTTKKPGFAGLFHEYLALRPAYEYAFINSLSNTNKIQEEMLRFEASIKDYYGKRERDIRRRLRVIVEDTH